MTSRAHFRTVVLVNTMEQTIVPTLYMLDYKWYLLSFPSLRRRFYPYVNAGEAKVATVE